MKVTYFEDTDTLYIEFRKAEILETFDYDDNTLIDADVAGHVCGISVEYAKHRLDLRGFHLSWLAGMTRKASFIKAIMIRSSGPLFAR